MSSERLTLRCLLTVSLLTFTPLAFTSASQSPKLDEADLVAAVTPESAETDMVVCKRFTPTGSRIHKRICLPQREWLRLREKAQKDTRDVRRVNNYVRYQRPDG
jgi:hypothetical protein